MSNSYGGGGLNLPPPCLYATEMAFSEISGEKAWKHIILEKGPFNYLEFSEI